MPTLAVPCSDPSRPPPESRKADMTAEVRSEAALSGGGRLLHHLHPLQHQHHHHSHHPHHHHQPHHHRAHDDVSDRLASSDIEDDVTSEATVRFVDAGPIPTEPVLEKAYRRSSPAGSREPVGQEAGLTVAGGTLARPLREPVKPPETSDYDTSQESLSEQARADS
ncbi:unnamed protein product, partial [Protopolystoma xenopodis]